MQRPGTAIASRCWRSWEPSAAKSSVPICRSRGGRSCLAGWLGGLDPIPDFNPLPLQQIAADAAAGRLDVKPTRIFRFDEIREAHRVMESGEARGKMVVVHA